VDGRCQIFVDAMRPTTRPTSSGSPLTTFPLKGPANAWRHLFPTNPLPSLPLLQKAPQVLAISLWFVRSSHLLVFVCHRNPTFCLQLTDGADMKSPPPSKAPPEEIAWSPFLIGKIQTPRFLYPQGKRTTSPSGLRQFPPLPHTGLIHLSLRGFRTIP